MARKIVREMIQRGLIRDEAEQEVRMYLEQAFAVGYNQAKYRGQNKKPIMKMDKEGKMIAIYESIITAARANDLNRSTIHRVIKGKYKTAGGFRWQYVPTKYRNEE